MYKQINFYLSFTHRISFTKEVCVWGGGGGGGGVVAGLHF